MFPVISHSHEMWVIQFRPENDKKASGVAMNEKRAHYFPLKETICNMFYHLCNSA